MKDATARRVALIFPGQGLQRPGMGSWVFRTAPEAGPLLSRLSQRVGVDLAELCAHGPADKLGLTQYTQPAVFAVGMAAYGCLASSGLTPLSVLGHSVGEIAALCAGGALTLEQGIGLVAARGRLMSQAPGHGAMGLICGLSRPGVLRCCADSAALGTIVIGAQNAQSEHVVSGAEAAVSHCLQMALCRGAQRAESIRTSHAFHSPLMAPVVDQWQAVVDSVALMPPRHSVVLNINAEPTLDIEQIRWAMVQQIISPVEWWQSMRALMRIGVNTVVVCDTSKYLARLARHAGLSVLSFADPRQRADLLNGVYSK